MKRWARVWLVVLALALAMVGCMIGGGGGVNGTDATATFGAGEWFAQMTAVAR